MRLILTMLLSPLVALAAAPRPAPGAEHTVIYRQVGQYSAFPVMYRLPDEAGTLMSMYDITSDGITGVESTRWRNPWRTSTRL